MMGKSAVATETATARDSRNQCNHFSSIHLEFVECGSCTPKTIKRGEEMAIWNHAVNARKRNLQLALYSGLPYLLELRTQGNRITQVLVSTLEVHGMTMA